MAVSGESPVVFTVAVALKSLSVDIDLKCAVSLWAVRRAVVPVIISWTVSCLIRPAVAPCGHWHLVKLQRKLLLTCGAAAVQAFNVRNCVSPLHLPPPAGFTQAGGVFLLLRAPPAGAPFNPNPAGLLEGPGTPAAPRRAEPHPQDSARLREARRAGSAAAGGSGEESPTYQELGRCGEEAHVGGL